MLNNGAESVSGRLLRMRGEMFRDVLKIAFQGWVPGVPDRINLEPALAELGVVALK
jgi:Trm5-related predicted tRNA methylase